VARESCPNFLLSLLTDQETKPEWRHLAFVALLMAGQDQAVESLMIYIQTLDPDSAGGPLKRVASYDARILDATENLFEEIQRAPYKAVDSFSPAAKQELCLGILRLPHALDRLTDGAADRLVVNDENDLNVALEAFDRFGSKVKSALLRRIVNYLLKERAPESLMGRDRTAPLPPVPEKALQLLTRALKGEFSGEDWRIEVESNAMELIAQYRISELLPYMEEIALHHPKMGLRYDAVRYMGAFLNLKTIPVLLECLKDGEEDVQEVAGVILDRMKKYQEQKRAWDGLMKEAAAEGVPEHPAAALIKLLESDDLQVRLAAIKSLGKLNDPKILPVLVRIVAEGTAEEREAAQAAIDAVKGD
jgi:HEAT repeat protein